MDSELSPLSKILLSRNQEKHPSPAFVYPLRESFLLKDYTSQLPLQTMEVIHFPASLWTMEAISAHFCSCEAVFHQPP